MQLKGMTLEFKGSPVSRSLAVFPGGKKKNKFSGPSVQYGKQFQDGNRGRSWNINVHRYQISQERLSPSGRRQRFPSPRFLPQAQNLYLSLSWGLRVLWDLQSGEEWESTAGLGLAPWACLHGLLFSDFSVSWSSPVESFSYYFFSLGPFLVSLSAALINSSQSKQINK